MSDREHLEAAETLLDFSRAAYAMAARDEAVQRQQRLQRGENLDAGRLNNAAGTPQHGTVANPSNGKATQEGSDQVDYTDRDADHNETHDDTDDNKLTPQSRRHTQGRNRAPSPEPRQTRATIKLKSTSTSQPRKKSQPKAQPKASSADILLCPYSNCIWDGKTHTGRKKHINRRHTHEFWWICPWPGCDQIAKEQPGPPYAAAARETVIRHLQGYHKMKELPGCKGENNEGRREVYRKQARAFQKRFGKEVDVSFFFTDGRDHAVGQDHVHVFRAATKARGVDVIDDDGIDGNSTNDADEPLDGTSEPLTYSDPQHDALLLLANDLEQDPDEFDFFQFLELVSTDDEDRDILKEILASKWPETAQQWRQYTDVIADAIRVWLQHQPHVQQTLVVSLRRKMLQLEYEG